MRILSRIQTAAYSAAPMLMALMAFKQVSLSRKWGNAPESAYGYSNYGLLLCGIVGDIESGYQFGFLAFMVVSALKARNLQVRVELGVHLGIEHWVDTASKTLRPLLDNYALALETGDLEHGAYATHFYGFYAFLCGKQLAALESEMANYTEVVARLGQERTVYSYKPHHQAVLNLIGQAENPCILMGTASSETEMLPIYKSQTDRTVICFLHFIKLMLCYLFGECAQAVANAELAENYLDGVTAQLTVTHFYFYDSLARLAAATDAPRSLSEAATKSLQKRLLRKVRANQKKMQKWAGHAPANNLHKFYLVEVERYRVLGKDVLAMEMYDKAIATAKQNEYIHEEALAHELAAKFYLAKGKAKIAALYMQDARYCYQLWGAAAKVKDLERRYSELLSRNSSVTRTGAISTTSTALSTSDSGRSSELDLATVMKASQAIAGEILLDKLLAKLMKILIENAGAQKGYLILESKGVERERRVSTD